VYPFVKENQKFHDVMFVFHGVAAGGIIGLESGKESSINNVRVKKIPVALLALRL